MPRCCRNSGRVDERDGGEESVKKVRLVEVSLVVVAPEKVVEGGGGGGCGLGAAA